MILDMEDRNIVFNALKNSGYSNKDAVNLIDEYGDDIYIYDHCECLGDIAKAIYNDEAQIVEDLEMASWVSVDWNGLAESLNNNRGMLTYGGYGIEIQW